MKTLFVLLIGAAIGIGAYLYFLGPERRADRTGAEREASASAETLKDKVSQGLTNLDTREIQDELERTGRVIRKKAEQAGTAIKDATADTRITTEIKGRFALDPDLSSLRISVNTTDGIVTLAGSASSAEEVKRAMAIALETEGVREVASTIQVKQRKD
ncbi:MAG: BON domain-containing protein [Verrucomicrobia bacterium]|nr:BON domain-containing protein [Verrucomicrobiota bacterium]